MNPLITSWFTKATHREVASDPGSRTIVRMWPWCRVIYPGHTYDFYLNFDTSWICDTFKLNSLQLKHMKYPSNNWHLFIAFSIWILHLMKTLSAWAMSMSKISRCTNTIDIKTSLHHPEHMSTCTCHQSVFRSTHRWQVRVRCIGGSWGQKR